MEKNTFRDRDTKCYTKEQNYENKRNKKHYFKFSVRSLSWLGKINFCEKDIFKSVNVHKIKYR